MSQIFEMFAIYDEKSCSFSVPFSAVNSMVAYRQFLDLALDSRSTVFAHPEDFSLYCIGSFDDCSASLTPLLPISLVCRAVDCLQSRGAAVGGESPPKSQSDQPEKSEETTAEL